MFKEIIISFETLVFYITHVCTRLLLQVKQYLIVSAIWRNDETSGSVFHSPLSNDCWKIEFVLAMTRTEPPFLYWVSCDTSTLTRIELDRTLSRLLCTFRNVVPNVNFTSTVTRVGKRAALTDHLLSIVKLTDKMRMTAYFILYF